MIGVIILIIILAMAYPAYKWFSAPKSLCGGIECAPPTPVCGVDKCVGCLKDTDCPTNGPRIVHGYSLAADVTPSKSIAVDTPSNCLAQALNNGALAAQYHKDTKKCDLFNTQLTAKRPDDPQRVLFEIAMPIKREE